MKASLENIWKQHGWNQTECGYDQKPPTVQTQPQSFAAPNGSELTGDGGKADGVRCSDLLGATRIFNTTLPKPTRRPQSPGSQPQPTATEPGDGAVMRKTLHLAAGAASAE